MLGSGIRHIHPRENVELAEQIEANGAILSELHPNTPPKGQNLMARDRIISGLSRAVIVVEVGEKSGSLDTASKALKQKAGYCMLCRAVPEAISCWRVGRTGLIRPLSISIDWLLN